MAGSKVSSRWGCSAAALMLAVGLAASPASAQVRWQSGTDDLRGPMSRADMDAALVEIGGGVRGSAGRAVIQFAGPISKAERAALEAAGVELLTYLGDYAYFANVGGTDAASLTGAAPVTSVRAIRREWKLHPSLEAGAPPAWSVVNAGEETKEAGAKTNPTIAVYVHFHPDTTRQERLDAIAQYGGFVRTTLRSIDVMVVEIAQSAIKGLADEGVVQYIEPPLPAMTEMNATSRMRTQAEVAQAAPYGLSGVGVNVMLYDGGQARLTHQDFAGRIFAGDTDGVSDHATHVGGTIGGSGAASGGANRGMAPGVFIYSYGFEVAGGLQPGFLYTDPGDLEMDYNHAINTNGAVVSNNSIGSNVAPNGYPCEWEGNYAATSQLIDAIVRGSLGSPMRIVWASGNERSSGRCGTTYNVIPPPSGAKNHIGVGALVGSDDSMSTFSSWGPTDDGRRKPDVSAPGVSVLSAGSGSDTSYTTKSGTSMASPAVCGSVALMIEDFRNQFPSYGADPLPSTVKALLMHGAQDLFNPGPDYMSGYGSIRIVNSLDIMRAEGFLESEIDQGGLFTALVALNAGDDLKVTMVWDDVPGAANTIPELVNDLDLQVVGPGGEVYLPWAVNPANPSAPATQDQPDRINNNEQVFAANPGAGVYRIEVRGFNVPQGPQAFSLAATPLLINCSSMGVVALDAQKYPCGATLGVRVTDCDLNTDDNVVETVQVVVSSDSETGGEVLTLTESGPETALFVGSIATSGVDAPGVLLAGDGDTISVVYIDADDGMGGMSVAQMATAVIDCTGPVITNVQVLELNPRDALIGFETDESAAGEVFWGSDCVSATNVESGLGLRTMHEIRVTGLQDDTTYSFAVGATDAAGNMSFADNGGACFGFTTPEVPDFFTQQFTSGSDLDGLTVTFTPSGDVDGYTACVTDAFGLPVDPAGGTAYTMTDDSARETVLSSGATVTLYGVSYDRFWAGSNGYLTFTAGDTDTSESYADHFDLPRISAMFDDLNPAAGGSVSWKQLSNQVVVTYQGVPQFSNSDSNTFQIQMFFDGTIAITWSGISSGDFIAGISAGEGLDPEFLPSDLSTYGACGPRPPFAGDVFGETPVATPVAIELAVFDDGLPETPGEVEHIIASLPANGSLSDPNAGAIVSAPYSLGVGNTVTYTPSPLFQGIDTFTFFGRDGGSPPDGGDSNVATASVMVGGPQTVYEWLLDSDPGWATEGQWAFGTPTGQGSRNPDPTSGCTGSFVYGYNLNGDYTNNMPRYYLTTEAFDCSNLSDTRLVFCRWLGVESAVYDDAAIQVSADGSTWTTVWEHTGPSVGETAWSDMEVDISAVADGQSSVRVRWAMGSTDGSVTYSGWNIDDVRIRALVPLVGCAGDLNGDLDVDFTDLNILLSAFGDLGPGSPGDVDGDGDCDFGDLNIMLSVFGDSCD